VATSTFGVAPRALDPDAALRATYLLHDLLEQIPTMFGRLTRLADAIDPSGQRYRIEKLDTIMAPELATEIIQREHNRILVEWLECPTIFRVADMAAHFRRALRQNTGSLVSLGRRRAYERLLPLEVPDITRLHFLTEMRILVPMVAARLELSISAVL